MLRGTVGAARLCYAAIMTREEIQAAITLLSADERARLRDWLDRHEEARRGETPSESPAQRFGRIAGRTFSDLRKRLRE